MLFMLLLFVEHSTANAAAIGGQVLCYCCSCCFEIIAHNQIDAARGVVCSSLPLP